MFDYQNIKNQFNEQGFVVISRLFENEQIDRLQKICDKALYQSRERYLRTHPKFDKKSCDLMKELQHLSDCEGLFPESNLGACMPRQNLLNFLLDTIADKQILSILDCICDRQLLFHGAVYFLNPEERSWRGDWHRDGQIIAPDDNTEKSRIFNSSFIRVHVALFPDDNLEIIAGSHTRWDTLQELEIRKGLNSKLSNSNEMPSVTKIHLNSGDAVFFDGYSIHRGNYFATKLRKTLAILFSSPVDWDTPQATCFLQPDILKKLSPQKREFWQKFIATYKNRWLSTADNLAHL